MPNRKVFITLSLVIGLLTLYGLALAHGTEKHGKIKAGDPQMKKLHDMMPVFSQVSARLEAAVAKGDKNEVKVQADKIRAAIPDLKKSNPNKNIKQRKNFVVQATNLETALKLTLDLAKKDDFIGAKDALKKVEKVCAACHSNLVIE